ncbi:Presequence protease, mitochondrial, partial [Irineochytrium annulatum]
MKIKHVSDLDVTAIELRHRPTGAQYVHVFSEDTNNVFIVGFRTIPRDSTGVAHILEHTALCGSEKFPVRDPFFKMLNRTAATYMNALTGSDMTMYPFSTENRKDFDNLMDVYMDSTFAPRLRETDFKQEGWRLEHEDPTDPSTPIIFKGVVYNEMKGVYSDVQNLFLMRLQKELYPGTIYANDSGGDPRAITDLTHEGLREFHARHYHPSNAVFYTYGNFPLEEHLAKVDGRISRFGKGEKGVVGKVRRLEAPTVVTETCPFDPMGDTEKQTRFSVTYLLNDTTDSYETFVLQTLSELLTGGPASPFYRALIEPNIGSGFSPGTGYDRSLPEAGFSVGLQGIAAGDVEMVEGRIRAVFEEAAKNGFPKDRIDGVLHQTEYAIKQKRANFGMSLGQGLIPYVLHGGDAVEAFAVAEDAHQQQLMARLREDVKRPGFFEERVKKYFLDNPHCVILKMEPSEQYGEAVKDEEEARLKAKVSALNEADLEKLRKEGLELKAIQETPDDPSCLPTLTVQDIPPTGKTFAVTEKSVSTSITPVQWRATATNGISYLTLSRRLQNLPPDLLPYLPLYSQAYTLMGTPATPSVANLDKRIRLQTGGVSFGVRASAPADDVNGAGLWADVSMSALDRDVPGAYDLVRELMAGILLEGDESVANLGVV